MLEVLPPDGRLRAPRRALPKGAVDCHSHIFDRFDKYPFSKSLKEHRGLFVGVAAIPPDADKKLLEKLNAAGFRAARLMDQFATAATTADLEPIAKLIAPFGWHIQLDGWLPDDRVRQKLFVENPERLYFSAK